uniref:BED-type domain-containing protein n=1 Tax=Pundamilia nyererei TaxID=303518 RepID=A0A3B4FBI5_9CICH
MEGERYFDIKVRCTLCVGEKVLSTFKNTMSNLKKHLESQHGTVKLTERVPPKQRAVTSAEGPKPPKQQKLDFGAKPVSDEELKKLVAQYIVEEMLPIKTVDSPSFPVSPNDFYFLLGEGVYGEKFEGRTDEIDIVSTVADIWTANNRSYMGVTLHWISRTTLERHKVALACRRIRGRHRYDLTGTEIENIHSSYGLLNKVVATVTDNGSNFVNAFQEESTPKDDDVTFSDLSEILSAENESDGQLSLPPHRRCASHTINIICTRDVEKHLSTNAESRAVYGQLFGPNQEDLHLHQKQWKKSLNTLYTKLGLKCFKDQEYQYLHEYCMPMKPQTAALDILQGDCPYSQMSIHINVQNSPACCYYCTCMYIYIYIMFFLYTPPPIFAHVEERIRLHFTAIQTRFTGVLDNKDALLAAASCPKFKLQWLRDTGRRERVKQLLTAECCTTAPLAKNPASVPSATTSSSQGEMAEAEEETYSAEKEVMDYLMSGYDLQILHNITLQPVERLFSLGDLVLMPKRNRLSDKRFEKLLLMRYNHWFTRSTLLFPP